MSENVEFDIPKENGLYWKNWTETEYEAWTQVILHSLTAIIILIMICIFYRIFTKTKNDEKDTKILKRLLSASLLVSFINIYGLYMICIIVLLVLNIRENNRCSYRLYIQVTVYIQRSIVFTFFLYRLKMSFEHTIYEISKTKFRVLLISLYALAISLQVTFFVAASFVDSFKCESSVAMDIVLYCIVGSGVVDVLWSIAITYMFVRRLQFVIKQTQQNSERLLHVIQKLTVLSFVMISSTLALMMLMSFNIFPYQLAGIDLIINNLCMALSFNVLKKEYQILCCMCIKCQNICCDKKERIPDDIMAVVEI